MRKSLKWALSLTLAASAVAFTYPEDNEPPANQPATRASAKRTALPLASFSLPEQLPLQDFSKPTADPFFQMQTAAAAQPALPPPPVVVLKEEEGAPLLAARYVGQFVTPQGARIVYLTNGNKEIAASVGTSLGDGYVVERIDEQGVHALHLRTKTEVVVAVPSVALKQ